MAYIELIIKEFLLYRGYPNSLKQFENECKNDKNKSFRVDKILELLTIAISNSDLQELRDLWKHLDSFFFSKLEQNYSEAVKKLENGLLKFYLVNAYSNNRSDKILEFFQKMSSEIFQQSEWKEWFYFQYSKNPEEVSCFAVCFTKQWQDTLMLSLHNFLATIFQSMPLPTLTRTEVESGQIRKLQEENTKLRQKIQTVQQQQQQQTPGSSVTNHQSRISSFNDRKSLGNVGRLGGSVSSPNDIIPFDIQPPNHLVDDFYIIAQETLSLSDSQARGIKSLIRNISSGTSPVLGRKDSANEKNKRSGSVGSNRSSWIPGSSNN